MAPKSPQNGRFEGRLGVKIGSKNGIFFFVPTPIGDGLGPFWDHFDALFDHWAPVVVPKGVTFC